MKVTTKLTAPGERAVYADGEYVGLITREPEGWMWTGDRKPHRTFTDAARHVVARKAQRDHCGHDSCAQRKTCIYT